MNQEKKRKIQKVAGKGPIFSHLAMISSDLAFSFAALVN